MITRAKLLPDPFHDPITAVYYAFSPNSMKPDYSMHNIITGEKYPDEIALLRGFADIVREL